MNSNAQAREPSLVLIIDDHPFVLQGCARILEESGVARVLQANTLVDGYRKYRAHQPDVVIVDLSIKTASLRGLMFISRLRRHDKQTPILVLSMHSDPSVIRRALSAGATGYLLKDASSDEFIKAFRCVLDGKPYLSHEIASEVAFSEIRTSTNPLRSLTARELETLTLIAEGKAYGTIADELSISYKTVANTTSQIKSKLGVRNLAELMRIAIQHLPNPSRSPLPR